jgi:hypothetical protein
MNALDVMLLALATWRLSSLLVDEDGPFDVFERVRRLANKVGMGKVFACIWCMSLWVSAALLLLYIALPSSIVISAWLSLSTVAILIERKVNRYE